MEDGMVTVPLGPCMCPGTPHPDGDEVQLRPKLGMARALAVIRTAAFDDVAVAEMQLAIGYARFGIAGWNLSNGDGKTMEVDGEHLTAFAETDPRAVLVALRGDELYADEVLAPLRTMAVASSRTTPTTDATSATNGTPASTRRRKPSKPSLTTTTQTGDTVTITGSLDGGSSS